MTGGLTEDALTKMLRTVHGMNLSLRPTHIHVPWRNAKIYWRATMTKRRWRRLRGRLKGRGL